MRERTQLLGATLLVLTSGALASGCGSGARDVKEAAVSVPAAAAITPDQAKKATRVKVLDDAEADQSFAAPDGTKLTKKPPAPGDAKPAKVKSGTQETKDNFISPGAPSDAQIAAELKQMESVQRKQAKAEEGVGGRLTLERDGTVTVGAGVPEVVARIVAGANAIAKYPYVYGGGHGTFVDTAYDCSGSLSYALAAGGLLTTTKVSGEFAKGGAPGPGKWITIYANGGHTFMVVGGIRYDTSGRGGPLGSRWQAATRSIAGFAVRHPPGL